MIIKETKIIGSHPRKLIKEKIRNWTQIYEIGHKFTKLYTKKGGGGSLHYKINFEIFNMLDTGLFTSLNFAGSKEKWE